jgi:hypothetical protein
MKKKLLLAILAIGLYWFAGVASSAVRAATRAVDNNSDDGGLSACTSAANDCSFRGAVAASAQNDTINFDPSLNGGTITLGSLVAATKALNIVGPGADKLTISGGNVTSIFEDTAFAGTLTVSGLTFANGNGVGGNNTGQGGAMEVSGGTAVVLNGVVFRDNSAAVLGGALLCFAGNCRITNSSFINNSAPAASVLYEGFGPNEIANTTVSGNTETSSTYGALYLRGTTTIRSCTIVNNSGRSNIYVSTENVNLNIGDSIVAGSAQSDFVFNGGAINTGGGNFIGRNNLSGSAFASTGMPNANGDYVGANLGPIDPQLAPAGSFGGGTLTRPPLPGSLTLDHGNNCVVNNSCTPPIFGPLTTDQRGAPRQVGAFVDIGAFETNFTFAQNSLPNGQTQVAYDQTIVATRQTSFAEGKSSVAELVPLVYETVPPSGATGLPPGLTLETSGQLHGIPTAVGGYAFLVKVTDQADGISGIFKYNLLISSPTAAPVNLSGRVFNPAGSGLVNGLVTLTDSQGMSRSVLTGTFGYFRFEGVDAGEIYVVSVSSKRYQYEPQVINVNSDFELSFVASP